MRVRGLQGRLTALGFSPGAIDGLPGPKTIAAIKAFQASRGLKPDGVIGPLTLAALGQPIHAVASVPAAVSPACVDLIKSYEGVADGNKATAGLEPHVDYLGKVIDIGFGHVILGQDGQPFRTDNLGADKALKLATAEVVRLFGAPSITRDQAKAILATDINIRAAAVAEAVGGAGATQAEFDGLVSCAFNIGVPTLKKSSLLRLHKAGARIPAGPLAVQPLLVASMTKRAPSTVAEAFGAYAYSNGDWILGLFRRRYTEALVYRGDSLASAMAAGQQPWTSALVAAEREAGR